jgi:hypothetical protein
MIGIVYQHRQTGRRMKLLDDRDGKGVFADGNSTVVCPMASVTLKPEEVVAVWPVFDLAYYTALIPGRVCQ